MELGILTYAEIYLSSQWPKTTYGSQVRIYRIKPTKYGYIITKVSTYVTVWTIKLHIFKDGSAKAQIKKDMNYRPIERFTAYFAPNGCQVIGGSTREELNYWKKLKN